MILSASLLGEIAVPLRMFELPQNCDLNTFRLQGNNKFAIYSIGANLPSNRPSGAADGYLIVFAWKDNSNTAAQIYIDHNSNGKTYFRSGNITNGWLGWKQFAFA